MVPDCPRGKEPESIESQQRSVCIAGYRKELVDDSPVIHLLEYQYTYKEDQGEGKMNRVPDPCLSCIVHLSLLLKSQEVDAE